MAFQNRQLTVSAQRKKQELVPCVRCGEDVPPNWIHCNGSSLAYGCTLEGPHHGKQLWPDCWKCGGVMGCTHCVPGAYQRNYQGEFLNADLICKRCRVKVTLESFLNGGPISRFSLTFGMESKRSGYYEAKDVPGIEAYPRQWISAYASQRARNGQSIEDDEGPEFYALLKMLRKFAAQRPMHIPTKRQLNDERNRQHEELAAVGGVAKVKGL